MKLEFFERLRGVRITGGAGAEDKEKNIIQINLDLDDGSELHITAPAGMFVSRSFPTRSVKE